MHQEYQIYPIGNSIFITREFQWHRGVELRQFLKIALQKKHWSTQTNAFNISYKSGKAEKETRSLVVFFIYFV